MHCLQNHFYLQQFFEDEFDCHQICFLKKFEHIKIELCSDYQEVVEFNYTGSLCGVEVRSPWSIIDLQVLVALGSV